jgi:hypothetical protein
MIALANRTWLALNRISVTFNTRGTHHDIEAQRQNRADSRRFVRIGFGAAGEQHSSGCIAGCVITIDSGTSQAK